MKRQVVRLCSPQVIYLLVWVMVTVTACLIALPAGAQEDQTLTTGELFRAKVFFLPEQEQSYEREVLGKDWQFSAKDRANFTFFSDGIKDLQVTPEGTLKFRLDAPKVTLGWGNFQDQQPVKARTLLWHTPFELKIEARQSGENPSKWTLRYWCDGKVEPAKPPAPVSLEGGKWQPLVFPRGQGLRVTRQAPPHPDGFGLDIEAAAGTEIEIKNVDILRRANEGYLRKEFDLPQEAIWRAVASVGNQVVLYVNGQEVPDGTFMLPRPLISGGYMYRTKSVDLKPYLRPGRNCIGIFGSRMGHPPYLYFQSQIVMRSGEIVRVDSDETWKWRPDPSPGWNTAGFDETAWKPITEDRKSKGAYTLKYLGLSYKHVGDRPAYDGYLVLENPDEARLFYADHQPFAANVSIPDGFASRQPVLEWAICRSQDGIETEVKSGTEKQFSKKTDSLAFSIKTDPLPRGVYALHTRLRIGDEIIEDRIPEPFIVVGKVPMKAVVGDSYEQGMELTLEDEIDFTDPNDPHPSLETDAFQAVNEPIIVERNGLKYRETRPCYRAQYSYNIKFQHPGDFYLMILDYPDDQERWMGVSLTPDYAGEWSHSKAAPAVFTGGKYPISKAMRQLQWVYRADPGFCAVNIISLQKDGAAAAAGLKIYHIAGRLPELKIAHPQPRWLGGVTENVNPLNSFGYTFCHLRQPVEKAWQVGTAGGAKADKNAVAEALRTFEDWLGICERYAEYLRFTGQNLHVMGSYQYSDYNHVLGNMSGTEGMSTARIPLDLREVAVRVFRENSIDVLANIEFAYHSTQIDAPESRVSNTQVRLGADTTRRVNRVGEQVTLTGLYSGGWNFLHPRMEETMTRVAEEMVERFKDQPNFLGVNWPCYFGGEWIPAYRISDADKEPLGNTYDDATIARFQKDTKIKVPGAKSDPKRFQKRYQFLTSPKMKERWIQWRCQKIKQFFDQVSKRIRRQRDDLQCVVSFYFYPQHTKEWIESEIPLRDHLRQWGWDPKLYQDNDHLWFAQQLHATFKYQQAFRVLGYACGWEQNVGREFYELYSRPRNRAVNIHHAWLEIERTASKMPKRENWAQPYQSTPQAQATEDCAREPFTQALIGSDPAMFIFGFSHVSLMVGHEQPMREFARVLRNLPPEKFQPVLNTGFQTNLAIRDLRKSGTYYFYVANPGYWPVRGSVTLTGAGQVLELASNRPVDAPGGVVPVSLQPYGVTAYRAEGAQAKVTSWRIEPVSEKDLAHLRALVERANKYLGDAKITALLPPDNVAFMQKAAAKAQADLNAGQYALAWSQVTNWRFWIVLNEEMEKAAQFGATLPAGMKMVDVSKLPSLKVVPAKQPPKMDGQLDDPVWQQAKPSSGFATQDKWPALISTTLRLAYDDKNLYIAVECTDPEPKAVRATAQGEKDVWSSGDDAVAMFLQPDPAQLIYYQMAFTAGGAKFDQQAAGAARDYDFAPPWEVATSVTKKGWIAEIMIPLSSLSASAAPGKAWHANFFRRFRQDLFPISHWSWVPSSAHDTSRFGELRFLPPA